MYAVPEVPLVVMEIDAGSGHLRILIRESKNEFMLRILDVNCNSSIDFEIDSWQRAPFESIARLCKPRTHACAANSVDLTCFQTLDLQCQAFRCVGKGGPRTHLDAKHGHFLALTTSSLYFYIQTALTIDSECEVRDQALNFSWWLGTSSFHATTNRWVCLCSYVNCSGYCIYIDSYGKRCQYIYSAIHDIVWK